MAAKVVTVAQQKGGAGKTTVAAHLAVALAEMGHKVCVVDTDPQQSLAAWVRVRAAFGAGNVAIAVKAAPGWKAGSEIDRAKREADIVVVDSPPHTESTAKTAIRAADLMLVPMQLSPMDMWATKPTLDLATSTKVPFLLVLNRVSPRGNLNEQVLREIAKAAYPVALARLGNRTAFAASLLDGLGVTESASKSPAAEEVRALAQEVVERFAARK
ncbi:ParA family protein [Oleomonas cavernae]|uniref:ParA family protein n=1 Tax=Oleomonas cavernae TaxID=2320859 RepID=A0A418WGS0_9PROT|nr:ParA family partition ATPase [Oleomonas cavernae]RJF89227.1 ParA family protein [Oleomonas cavernae]